LPDVRKLLSQRVESDGDETRWITSELGSTDTILKAFKPRKWEWKREC
jgi:hypothetical protein